MEYNTGKSEEYMRRSSGWGEIMQGNLREDSTSRSVLRSIKVHLEAKEGGRGGGEKGPEG